MMENDGPFESENAICTDSGVVTGYPQNLGQAAISSTTAPFSIKLIFVRAAFDYTTVDRNGHVVALQAYMNHKQGHYDTFQHSV